LIRVFPREAEQSVRSFMVQENLLV
jgi:hypothetical protein